MAAWLREEEAAFAFAALKQLEPAPEFVVPLGYSCCLGLYDIGGSVTRRGKHFSPAYVSRPISLKEASASSEERIMHEEYAPPCKTTGKRHDEARNPYDITCSFKTNIDRSHWSFIGRCCRNSWMA